jgi:hypothetical protein
MSDPESSTKNPGWRINRPVIIGFLVLTLLALLGVVFIPWDAPKPETSDLELTPATLDPAENAFTYFMAAEKLPVTTVSQPWALINVLCQPIGGHFELWDQKQAETVLADHAAVFAELEKGLACRGYASPDALIAAHCQQRQSLFRLCQLFSLKAKQSHLAGDYTGALQAIDQGLQIGRLVTANARFSAEWHTGINCKSVVMGRLEELVADASTPEPVLLEIQKQLGQEDLQCLDDSLRKSLHGEFRQNLNLLEDVIWNENSLGPGARSKWELWLLQIPYIYKPNMTQWLIADHCRYFIANAGQPYAKFKRGYPDSLKMPTTTLGKAGIFIRPNLAGKGTFTLLTSNLEQVFAEKSGLSSYISALQLKIALRWYERKHGELPNDLSNLVPEFIPEIPRDPYDGNPFRYSKTGKKIWVIGKDLIDQGGKAYNNDFIKLDVYGYDLVMPLGTRELKPIPASKPAAPKPPQGASTP